MLARVHLGLGLLVAVPTFFWAASGLLYSLPGQVQGSTFGHVDPATVRVVGERRAARVALGAKAVALTRAIRPVDANRR